MNVNLPSLDFSFLLPSSLSSSLPLPSPLPHSLTHRLKDTLRRVQLQWCGCWKGNGVRECLRVLCDINPFKNCFVFVHLPGIRSLVDTLIRELDSGIWGKYCLKNTCSMRLVASRLVWAQQEFIEILPRISQNFSKNSANFCKWEWDL